MSKPSSDPADFITAIEVLYTEDNKQPQHTVGEMKAKSADINKGFNGMYVWLRVRHASKPEEMANHIWRDNLDEAIEGRDDDLSKGAGGTFRYLQWSHDMRASYFITSVWLWRCDEEQNSPPEGWSGKTDDINAGRGGDYLYLIWKTREYNGVKP